MNPGSLSRFLVYGLVDPRTEEIRYIGLSTQGLKRPKQHHTPYYLNNETNTHKARWIRQLLSEGLIPDIVVLKQCVSVEEVEAAERDLIAEYRALGARLTNLADGGLGPFGVIRSEDTKKRMSKAKLGKPRPPHVGEAISRALKGKPPANPEHVRRLGESWKGQKRSEETKARMSAAKKEWWVKNREAHTARLKEAGKSKIGRKLSPETVAKMSASTKGRKKSEETKARMSEAKRAWWAAKKAAEQAESSENQK